MPHFGQTKFLKYKRKKNYIFSVIEEWTLITENMQNNQIWFKCSCGLNTVVFKGSLLWNNLSNLYKDINTEFTFKEPRRLHRFILDIQRF